jgi:hypothetical protein
MQTVAMKAKNNVQLVQLLTHMPQDGSAQKRVNILKCKTEMNTNK